MVVDFLVLERLCPVKVPVQVQSTLMPFLEPCRDVSTSPS